MGDRQDQTARLQAVAGALYERRQLSSSSFEKNILVNVSPAKAVA